MILVFTRKWHACYRVLRHSNGFSFMVYTATPSAIVGRTNSLHTPARRTQGSNKNEGGIGATLIARKNAGPDGRLVREFEMKRRVRVNSEARQ
jgi:hypothetical protein